MVDIDVPNWNGMSIDILPTELVVEILLRSLDTYPYPYLPYLWKLSKVCTRWWRIIVSTSELWGFLNPRDPVDFMLRKSQNVPLSLVSCMPIWGKRESEYYEAAAEHFERWVVFKHQGNHLMSVAPYLLRHLPNLEVLSLSFSTVPHYSLSRLNLAAGPACGMFTGNWYTKSFRNDLFSALRACPDLESLTFDAIYEQIRIPDDGQPVPPIHLPRLQRLVMSSSTFAIFFALLNPLCVMNLSKLIATQLSGIRPDDTPRLAAALFGKGRDADTTPLSVALLRNPSASCSVSICDLGLSIRGETTDNTAIDISLETRHGNPEDMGARRWLIELRDLKHCLPFSRMKAPLHFNLTCRGRISRVEASFLVRMPTLSSLSITLANDDQTNFPEHVARILGTLACNHTLDDGTFSVPAPALRRISLDWTCALDHDKLVDVITRFLKYRNRLIESNDESMESKESNLLHEVEVFNVQGDVFDVTSKTWRRVAEMQEPISA
ncbi:hypothetical protein FRB99_008413 [Tulasnella sp. 403]|nr:hypothetical protein FRB99_008413 [Tulasnella sp. 403]